MCQIDYSHISRLTKFPAKGTMWKGNHRRLQERARSFGLRSLRLALAPFLRPSEQCSIEWQSPIAGMARSYKPSQQPPVGAGHARDQGLIFVEVELKTSVRRVLGDNFILETARAKFDRTAKPYRGLSPLLQTITTTTCRSGPCPRSRPGLR